jgi:hypothetical protein
MAFPTLEVFAPVSSTDEPNHSPARGVRRAEQQDATVVSFDPPIDSAARKIGTLYVSATKT